MIAASSIELLENPPDEFGESIAASSPEAYFFHTPRYLRFWKDAQPLCTNVSLGFVFEDGSKAFLPLLSTNVGWGMWRRYESIFRGFGGPIGETELSPDRKQALLEKTLQWARERRMYQLMITSSPASPSIPLSGWGSRVQSLRESARSEVVTLPATVDDLLKGFNQSRRRSIKLAERSGVVTRLASSEQDYVDFCEVYQDRVRRWGELAKGKYQLSFFLALRRAAEQTEDMKLWLATDENRVCAGAIVLYHGKRANYWLGASLEDDSKRANTYLHFCIISDAIARGFTIYDMGRSGREGVRNFKTQFGALPEAYEILTLDDVWKKRALKSVGKLQRLFRSWPGRR